MGKSYRKEERGGRRGEEGRRYIDFLLTTEF
jgi:hypothetical protein